MNTKVLVMLKENYYVVVNMTLPRIGIFIDATPDHIDDALSARVDSMYSNVERCLDV